MRLIYTTGLDLSSDFLTSLGNWFSLVLPVELFENSNTSFSLIFNSYCGAYSSTWNCLDNSAFQLLGELVEPSLSFIQACFLNYEVLFSEWIPGDCSWFAIISWSGVALIGNWSIHVYFICFYLVYIFVKILVDVSSSGMAAMAPFSIFIELYLISWIVGGEDKVETTEEILVLFILWPWCVFLIFSHTFGFSEHTVVFGFAEWGLPVMYGYILLLEHVWIFGTYIGVYLMGVRARKSIIINLIEDLIAMTIMIARVSLQMVRGIIVGMFHLICREALLNMNRWWINDIWVTSGSAGASSRRSCNLDMLTLWVDWWLAVGSLVVVTAIMFLQLIFLIVSVWLFCKCWYISWLPKTYSDFAEVPKASQSSGIDKNDAEVTKET